MTVKPRFIGSKIHRLEICESTNDEAAKLLRGGDVQEGTIIVSNEQKNGRGQRGNDWSAFPGQNLTFSVVVKPVFLKIQDQFYLNILVALAVSDLLIDLKIKNVKVKWPNDILVGTKKICGILIENTVRKVLDSSVLGIGLNVNQVDFEGLRATSIVNELDIESDKEVVLYNLASLLGKRYEQLRTGELSVMKNDYLRRLYGMNHALKFDDGEQFSGEIVGISDYGQLQIVKSGKLKTYNMQEVKFRFDQIL